MARLSTSRDFLGATGVAEELWYDPARWAAWIDGFGHVASLEGDWPHPGATLTWDSRAGGRGRVVERVQAYEPGVGQTLAVEDGRLHGTQRVAFQSLEGGVAVTLSLDYELSSGGPLTAVLDLLFIRRALADSLNRSLLRFGRELDADRRLLA